MIDIKVTIPRTVEVVDQDDSEIIHWPMHPDWHPDRDGLTDLELAYLRTAVAHLAVKLLRLAEERDAETAIR